MLASLVHRARPGGLALAAAAVLTLVAVAPTQAHVLKTFGSYSVALGWKVEPTYVGSPNAVQVIVKDSKSTPVTDIPDGDMTVVVSIAGQSTSPLPLDNAFDSDTGLGIEGDYEAPLDPTIVGDYTFHLSGTIHGVKVDETATSSDSTFDSVVDSSSVDFPTKLPSISDLATSIDRIEARASAAPFASGAANASQAPAASSVAGDPVAIAQSALNAANQASDSASTALQVGILVGAVGIIVGAIALALALRRRPNTP